MLAQKVSTFDGKSWILADNRVRSWKEGRRKMNSINEKFFFQKAQSKWKEIPAGNIRVSSEELLHLSDCELLDFWQKSKKEATEGPAFKGRGWYHALYADALRGKRVLDVGSGFGIDGITFAQKGAKLTFLDVVESNLKVIQRVCGLLGVKHADFFYMENVEALNALQGNFDVIWCQGSLINAPFDMIRKECQELLKHLPIGGRWIELAYPKERWEREGGMPFESWGSKTDGGAPWMEWYNLEKLEAALSPATFEVLLNFNFHSNDFCWFDLLRKT